MHIVQMETREQIEARLPPTKRIVITHGWRIKSFLEKGWERGEEFHNLEVVLEDNGPWIHFLNPDFNGKYVTCLEKYYADKIDKFYEVRQIPPHDIGFTFPDGQEGITSYTGFYSTGSHMPLEYNRRLYVESHGLRDIREHKLKPKTKQVAILSALANATRPMTTAELRKVVGEFGSTTMMILTGKWQNSGWFNIPLVHAVSRGKYEITNLGVQALKDAGV
jgi:hypothetical protein